MAAAPAAVPEPPLQSAMLAPRAAVTRNPSPDARVPSPVATPEEEGVAHPFAGSFDAFDPLLSLASSFTALLQNSLAQHDGDAAPVAQLSVVRRAVTSAVTSPPMAKPATDTSLHALPLSPPLLNTAPIAVPAPVTLPAHEALPLTVTLALPVPVPQGTAPDERSPIAINTPSRTPAGTAPSGAPPQAPLVASIAFSARIQVTGSPSFSVPGTASASAAQPSALTAAPAPTPEPAPEMAGTLSASPTAPKSESDSRISLAPKSEPPKPAPAAALESAPLESATLPNSVSVVNSVAVPLASAQKAPAPHVEAPAASPAPSPASSSASAAPLKEISFQLPGARGVEVKLTESQGQVRVDVRSADPTLTQDLRGNLHELVNTLERKGLSAEITHPDGTTLRTADASGARNFSSQNSDENAGGDRQHDDRQSGQQERPRQQPQTDLPPQKARTVAWRNAIATHLEERP